MPLHDLRCPACEVTEKNVYFRANTGFPVCPDCGNARNVDWSHGAAPTVKGEGYGSFTAVDMGVLGKAETKEDYDRAVATIQKRFPGHRVELSSESKSQKSERLDSFRQRAHDGRKRDGIDDTIRREILTEQTARKAEAAAKGITLKPPAAPGVPA